jgi:hypothetical protein
MTMPSVDEFLAAYPADVRAIAQRARALILSIIPDAIEQVDTSAKLLGYGYDRTYKGLICGIAMQKGCVNLMFSKGTELPDPDGLLEGTGKKARHVKLRSPQDVDKTAVREFERRQRRWRSGDVKETFRANWALAVAEGMEGGY